MIAQSATRTWIQRSLIYAMVLALFILLIQYLRGVGKVAVSSDAEIEVLEEPQRRPDTGDLDF